METNTLVIRSSFWGIAGDFLKNIFIIVGMVIIYLFCSNIKMQYYTEYNITSFLSFVMELKHIKEMGIISFIYILYVVIFFIVLSTSYKTVKLFYEILKKTVIDYESGRITSTTYSFPFNKEVDENKFSEVINVNIDQDLFHQLFRTGHIYIEYIACNKVDSQLRSLQVTYVARPFKLKSKMLDQNPVIDGSPANLSANA
jgi:hypothetical protein